MTMKVFDFSRHRRRRRCRCQRDDMLSLYGHRNRAIWGRFGRRASNS